MKELWDKIEQRLTGLGCLQEMRLGQGATTESLEALERHIGISLPDSVKSFLLIHDGQKGFGLIQGEGLLSVDGIRKQWDMWRSIDEEEMNIDCADFMASEPAGHIRPMYTNRLWIPLTSDGGGNHIGLDYDPDSLGTIGQVIAFGRDEDTKRLLANDFVTFVMQCISWLDCVKWNGKYLEDAA
jgi:cell wall assembly regulator SMI1